MKALITMTCVFLAAGCVSIPYPHKAYHHSYISGRVVDRVTKAPIENITVQIANDKMVTKQDGAFEFVPTQKQHFVFNLPLLPFDFWLCGGDQLHLTDYDKARNERGLRYRGMSIEVDSCPYPFLGAEKREENLRKFDRLGDIELRTRK